MVAAACETDASVAMGPRLRGDDNLLSSRRWSKHLSDPVVRIGRAAVLDVDQLLAHPHRARAGGPAVDDEIAAPGTHLADRRDHGGGTAGKRLFQLAAGGIAAPLLDRVGLLTHWRA